MIIDIHPINPQSRNITQVAEILKKGGIIAYPSDTVYALGCDFANQKAVEKICALRGVDPVKANLTFFCDSIKTLAGYAAPIANDVFKLIKRNTPGPFTFILKSNNSVPKLFKNKKRTIGARIPDNPFMLDLIQELGNPLMSMSLKPTDSPDFFADFDTIVKEYEKQVEAIIRTGIVPNEPSAIVDCTGDEALLEREGPKEIV